MAFDRRKIDTQIGAKARILYLWTQRGALLHAKIIQKWHHRDDWKSLADAVDREVREKVVKKIANELEAEGDVET